MSEQIDKTEGGITDGAAISIVAEHFKLSLESWNPKARIVGNIRAEDLLRLCDKILGSNKKRRDQEFKSFVEGETYFTAGSCSELFKITKIVTSKIKDTETIIKFLGEYVNRPDLGTCPLLPELLLEK